ncbi:16S rRNA (cytosine(1402)-N(4))-methyltransferase, partial [Acinetobacter baumannii]
EDPRFSFELGPYDEVLWRMVRQGERADAVLFDLGLSSFQVEDARRGFSYTREGPLDMRMDPGSGPSAADFLNAAGEEEIYRVLVEY